jgi:hypothetical protein
MVSCPHTHKQNGSAEHKHRHIVDVGLSLLSRASMPLKFWDEAYLTVTFLINQTPSRVISHQTPLERLLGQKPDYAFLHTFGCECWPNMSPYNTQKLSFRSTQCVFLGYSNRHKGYKCLEPSTGRVYISHNVIFDEIVFPFSTLHANAGAQLQSEIILLHPTLHSQHGGDRVDVSDMANAADNLVESSYVDHGASGEEGEENSLEQVAMD